MRHPRQILAGLFFLLVFAVIASPALAADAVAPAGEAADASEGLFSLRAFLGPFHSVTLHLPIGFVLLAFLLDIYYMTSPSKELRRAVTMAIIISFLSAALVVGLGLLRASDGGYDPALLYTHKIYGILVAVLTFLLAVFDILAYRGDGNNFLKVVYRTIFIADLALLAIAGHYGGNLTHGSKYLVENAPEWVQAWMEGMDETLIIEVTEDDIVVATPLPTSDGYYANHILPIFEEKCYSCHGPEKQKGDYRLDSPKDALAAGESELPAIVPFRPRESFLVDLITLPSDADEVMPPEGKEALTAEEIVKIIRWVHSGAKFGDPTIDEAAGE